LDLPDFALHRAPEPQRPVAVSALETTREGVWLLQALCGVETMPTVLMLQPYVSAAGPPAGHPGIAILREAGALVDDDTVHPRIAEWFEVLGAPDVELYGDVRRGSGFQDCLHLAVARRDDLHVAASRYQDAVTIEELGRVDSPRELVERILPLCGPPVQPVDFEPLTVPTLALIEVLTDVVRGGQAPSAALAGLGPSARQRRVLTQAADQPLTMLSLGVVQHDSHGDHIANGAVTVIDTTNGRIVAGPVRGEDGTWWTHISPGTVDAVARSLRALVATLPTPAWREHSRLN
jgi:ESX secretion-associated protein EspG